ncbi:MAG: hypothetical protein JO353_00750 [Phycisphaerae bacterium]|nr:hypothetical protein [Phycisphaerae bacterium]
MSEVYRQWGFNSGYAQATRDHLELFVANAEAVLNERGGTWAERDSARRLLYGFVARLERRMGQFGGHYDESDDVELPLVVGESQEVFGGLGI